MSPIPVAFPLPFDIGGVSDGVTGAVGSVGTSVAPVADTVAQTGQTVGTTIATTATTVGEAVGTAAEQVAAQIDNVLKLMENWAMDQIRGFLEKWLRQLYDKYKFTIVICVGLISLCIIYTFVRFVVFITQTWIAFHDHKDMNEYMERKKIRLFSAFHVAFSRQVGHGFCGVFNRKALVAKFDRNIYTPWDFKRDSEIRLMLEAKEGLIWFEEWHGHIHRKLEQ